MMDVNVTWQTKTTTAEQTEQLGEKLGSRLKGGEVIELVSDLGGGKTTFTRGLVRGSGSQDKVASPTFTINREYQAPRFTIAHFDFYRLDQAGIVANELAEMIGDSAYVLVVEWGDVVHDVLPAERLTITLAQTKDGDRDVQYTYPETLSYLVDKESL